MLKDEFLKDGGWDKEKTTAMSKITGYFKFIIRLTESQVYKWCWD